MLNDKVIQVSKIAYFISKYDTRALCALGYENYSQAFREISNIFDKSKNYVKFKRDQFDALVSNTRKGWHNRKPEPGILQLHNELKDYTFDEFLPIVQIILQDNRKQTKNNSNETSSNDLVAKTKGTSTKPKYSVAEYILDFSDKIGCQLSLAEHNLFINHENNVVILQLASKSYPRASLESEYWYSIHPKQLSLLMNYHTSYIGFLLTGSNTDIVFLTSAFLNNLGAMPTTTTDKETYWHVKIRVKANSYYLLTKSSRIELSASNTAFIIDHKEKNQKLDPPNNEHTNTGKRIKITSNLLREINYKGKK